MGYRSAMIVLGLSPTAHESSVGLFVEGRLVAAAAEERFTRKKNQAGFPGRALDYVLAEAGMRASDVDVVAYAVTPFAEERRRDLQNYAVNLGEVVRRGVPGRSSLAHLANYTRGLALFSEWESWGGSQRTTLRTLRERGFGRCVFVDHHEAHCASAYYTSGFDRCLAVSLDGYGSGKSGAVYRCAGGRMEKLTDVPYPHSLGTFYRRVTQALGFKPNRHEGKIVGLAAFGDPERLLPEVLARFERSDPGKIRLVAPHDPYFERTLAAAHPREHVAAAYQRALEIVASEFVAAWLARSGETNLACAGGVFANVKMNQRIAELPGVESMFVYPAMGDGGVGVGAAMVLAGQSGELTPSRLRDVYLGPSIGELDAERALRDAGLAFDRPPDLAAAVVDDLVAGRVVARATGRMEFGPRALGHRSILYEARDPEVNRWLNERLRRTEFMPFAPITRDGVASKLFAGIEKVRHAAEFMTVTLDCTAVMQRDAPAAVHVDGTARPQLVREDVEPEVYAILARYAERTGLDCLINTSFNMHEEPIVGSASDAVRAFLDSELDVLALGPFIARSPGAAARAEQRAAE